MVQELTVKMEGTISKTKTNIMMGIKQPPKVKETLEKEAERRKNLLKIKSPSEIYSRQQPQKKLRSLKLKQVKMTH